jgi:4-amino-4-deoxy-L-arabinose transferase-like glycosyltransferase
VRPIGIPIFFALVMLLLQVAGISRLKQWNASPGVGDASDYENIAFNLYQGRGYGFLRDDPLWRAPYEAQLSPEELADLRREPSNFEPTTLRPPLVPAIIAVTYLLLGRELWPWRLFNCVLIAIGAGLVAALALREFGKVACLAACCLMLWDETLMPSVSAAFVTEGVSFFLVALLLMLLTSSRPSSAVKAVVSGVLFCLLVLTRTVTAVWLPVLVVFWLVTSHGPFLRRIRPALLFSLSFLLLLLPWAIRNCEVASGFMPLGVQGAIELPLGYSDRALLTKGTWTGKGRAELLGGFQAADNGTSVESQAARFGEELALSWLKGNWEKLPKLMFLKVTSLWWSRTLPQQKVLVILALVGLLLAAARQRTQSFWLCLTFWIAHSLAVSLTWVTGGGRFLMPLYSTLYLLGGACVAISLATVRGWLSSLADSN